MYSLIRKYYLYKNTIMKKLLTFLLVSGMSGVSYAQSLSSELIAHWDMNSEVNDVSGNGHNGTASNLTPAIGSDGVMGHAYYFNRTNSVISVPYSPAFNVSNYSISAVVEVMGFYTGTCQNNLIFERGRVSSADVGNYYLFFNDKPGDGYSCTSYDTTVEVFEVSSADLPPALPSDYYYTPTIVENQWYNVVVTFNDTAYVTYVNGVLKATAYITTPGVAIGSSTEGIYIGYDAFDAGAGYPFPFNGNIDDIKLYNAVLTDSQIVHINDTCGSITTQPVSANTTAEATEATFTVNTSIVNATYQWQGNSGAGFVNLSNAGPYSGVTTPTLTVTGSSAVNNDVYQCIVSNSWGCADTSSSATLTVGLGVGNVLSNGMLSIYPNPAQTHLYLQSTNLPITQVTISNILGQTIYTKACNSLKENIDISALSPGVYFIKINEIEVRKFVKE